MELIEGLLRQAIVEHSNGDHAQALYYCQVAGKALRKKAAESKQNSLKNSQKT